MGAAMAGPEVADGEVSFAVSQPPSDFACGKHFAEKEQVSPRVHFKDNEENGDQPCTGLPMELVF